MIRSCLATVLVAFVWMTSCADENDDLFWREIRKDVGVGGVMDCRKEGEHPLFVVTRRGEGAASVVGKVCPVCLSRCRTAQGVSGIFRR